MVWEVNYASSALCRSIWTISNIFFLGGFASHQTEVPSVNDRGLNAQTGLPVPSASRTANHSIIPPSSYSVGTPAVDVKHNIDRFSPESVKSSNQRRDSLDQHPKEVSKEAVRRKFTVVLSLVCGKLSGRIFGVFQSRVQLMDMYPKKDLPTRL